MKKKTLLKYTNVYIYKEKIYSNVTKEMSLPRKFKHSTQGRRCPGKRLAGKFRTELWEKSLLKN